MRCLLCIVCSRTALGVCAVVIPHSHSGDKGWLDQISHSPPQPRKKVGYWPNLSTRPCKEVESTVGVCAPFFQYQGDWVWTTQPLWNPSVVQGGCARAISVVRAGKATTSRLPVHVRWSVGTIDGKNSLTPPHLQNDPVPPPVQWGMSRSKGDVVVVVWDMCHGH